MLALTIYLGCKSTMDSPNLEQNGLVNSASVSAQYISQKVFPPSIWERVCCQCRRRTSAAPPLKRAAIDRSSRVPARSQVLPDFVVRMSAPYLCSVDIARLFSVDQSSCTALALPGLVREMVILLGMEDKRLTTLAQLHLAEHLPLGTNVINFEFLSTDIDRNSKLTLDRIAKLLRQHPLSEVSIEAHAQPGAPPDIAKSISQARGNAVSLGLQKRKVDESRLHVEGYGTTRRVHSASDKAHRRAEIFVSLGDIQFPRERLPFTQVQSSSDRFAAWAAADDASDDSD